MEIDGKKYFFQLFYVVSQLQMSIKSGWKMLFGSIQWLFFGNCKLLPLYFWLLHPLKIVFAFFCKSNEKFCIWNVFLEKRMLPLLLTVSTSMKIQLTIWRFYRFDLMFDITGFRALLQSSVSFSFQSSDEKNIWNRYFNWNVPLDLF